MSGVLPAGPHECLFLPGLQRAALPLLAQDLKALSLAISAERFCRCPPGSKGVPTTLKNSGVTLEPAGVRFDRPRSEFPPYGVPEPAIASALGLRPPEILVKTIFM